MNYNLLKRYTQALWFLEGIPLVLREKIIWKYNISLIKFCIMDFKVFFKTAMSFYESNQANKEIT